MTTGRILVLLAALALVACAAASPTAVPAPVATPTVQITDATGQPYHGTPVDEHAHDARILAKEQATCTKVGGTWGTNLYYGTGCHISYRSTGDGEVYNYFVAFDAEGNVVPYGNLAENASAEACAAYGRKLGFGTVWHADTMICAI